jgi:hypothetical protein
LVVSNWDDRLIISGYHVLKEGVTRVRKRNG